VFQHATNKKQGAQYIKKKAETNKERVSAATMCLLWKNLDFNSKAKKKFIYKLKKQQTLSGIGQIP
jgi:hypothetical protein